MAPPPFKVVGDLPKPLTVAETAKVLRVSPREAERIQAILRAMSAKAHKSSPAANATKAAAASSRNGPGKTSARKALKVSKTAARSSR